MKRQLPTFYYLTHFSEFLSYFEGEKSIQLPDECACFIKTFKQLPMPQQCIVARASNRKYSVISVTSMRYQEIENNDSHFKELISLGWFSECWSASAYDIVNQLTKTELYDVLERFDGSLIKKSYSKGKLSSLFCAHFHEVRRNVASPANYLYIQFHRYVDFLLFLYFGHLGASLSHFSMRDLGLMRIRSDIATDMPRFESAAAAECAYFYATQLRAIKTEQAAIETLSTMPEPTDRHSQVLRDKYLLTLGDHYAKTDPEKALVYWQASEHPTGQEKWIRERYRQGEKSCVEEALKAIIANPSSDALALFAEDFYQRKYNKKRTSPTTDMLRHSVRQLAIDINYKQSVERGVMSYYSRHGTTVFRTENRLWRTLFGLTFWEILYADNYLSSPFDGIPKVLKENRFYDYCQSDIEALIAGFESASVLLLHVTRIAASEYGKVNRIFQWHKRLLEPVRALIEHAELPMIIKMLLAMAKDFRQYNDGFPDIMCIEGGHLRFEEIKAPGDVLRKNQLLAIRQLHNSGFSASITHVNWTVDTEQPYVVVDVETTGGQSSLHRITEVGMVKIINGEVVDEYHTLINPERHIPASITHLTGISNEMVAASPTFDAVAEDIINFTENSIFVAHNVNFDYGFIKQALARSEHQFKRPKLCTVSLSRKLYPGLSSYRLNALCQRFNIDLKRHHRALDDARATAELFIQVQKNETFEKLVSVKPVTEGI